MAVRQYGLMVRLGCHRFTCGVPDLDLARAQRRAETANANLAVAREAHVSPASPDLRRTSCLSDLIARADAVTHAQQRTHRPERAGGAASVGGAVGGDEAARALRSGEQLVERDVLRDLKPDHYATRLRTLIARAEGLQEQLPLSAEGAEVAGGDGPLHEATCRS